MFGDVDRLAAGEFGLHSLGNHACGRKPPDQLQLGFAALVEATLIGDDGARNIAKSTSYGAPDRRYLVGRSVRS